MADAPACKECGTECVERTSKTVKNPDRKFWSCEKRCRVWNGWLDETVAPAYLCERCIKTLDVQHEIDNHVKRLGPLAAGLRGEISKELKEDMKAGTYTCESCIKNTVHE